MEHIPFQIVGSDDFHFSALPYSIAEYRKATYEEELPEQTTGTWLILDVAHAGLGGDTAGRKIFTRNIVYAREDTAIRSVSISHKRKNRPTAYWILTEQITDFS